VRLTLRTLLAYLDDTLDSEAAKEIGAKLQESEFAQDLVDRIKRVLRSRRLSAPAVVGGTVDANTVAEYLDNVLDPHGVTECERQCLQSDELLAEVAACHQILTLLGQPAEVPPGLPDRLYRRAGFTEAPSAPMIASPLDAAKHPLLEEPRRPLVWPYFAATLVLLLLAAFVGYQMYQSYRQTSPLAQAPEAPEIVGAGQEAAATGTTAEKPADVPKPAPTPPSKPEEKLKPSGEPSGPAAPRNDRLAETTASPQAPSEVGRAPIAAPKGQPPTAAPQAASSPVPPTTAGAAEASQTAPAPSPTPQAAEPQPPGEPPKARPDKSKAPEEKPSRPPVPAPVARFVGSTGLVAIFDGATRDWVVAVPDQELPGNTMVLNLDNFRSRLVAGPWILDLIGLTRLSVEEASATRLVVRLDFGKFVLRTTEMKEPPTVTVTVPDRLTFRLTLKGSDLAGGIVGESRWTRGGPYDYRVSLLLLGSSEAVLERSQDASTVAGEGSKPEPAEPAPTVETVVLKAPVEASWTALNPQLVQCSPLTTPAWWASDPAPLSQRKVLEEFRKAMPAQGPLAVRLFELLHDWQARMELRLMALRTMVAMGRLRPVVEMLGDTDSRLLRQEAARWLRWYVAMGPQFAVDLEIVVRQVFEGQERADTVLQLLAGLPEPLVKDPKTYEALIQLLDPSVELAIRELSIATLEELTGTTNDYNPDAPNERAIVAWKRALERGSLPPKRPRRSPSGGSD
jgi:hypothetical protein